MALNSSSTRQDAINQYNDNLAWEGNPTKANLALEALRFLRVNRPNQFARNQGSSFSFSSIDAEISKLEGYLSRSSSAVKRCSFTRGRMV